MALILVLFFLFFPLLFISNRNVNFNHMHAAIMMSFFICAFYILMKANIKLVNVSSNNWGKQIA